MYRLDKTGNCVFSLCYHLIVVVKYRRKVFENDSLVSDVKTIVQEIKVLAEEEKMIMEEEKGLAGQLGVGIAYAMENEVEQLQDEKELKSPRPY